MKKSRQKKKKNKKDLVKDIKEKIREEESNPSTKAITEFNWSLGCSVKLLSFKKDNNVTPTTRFFQRKDPHVCKNPSD